MSSLAKPHRLFCVLGLHWAAVLAASALYVVGSPALHAGQSTQEQPPASLFDLPRPQVAAYRTDQAATLDGVLDEAMWQQAEVASNFLQQEPDEGQPASQRTEFQVAYDQTTLFFAVRAFDTEPDKLIAKEMGRDGRLRNDDGILILLDTFRDQRNAYFFETNLNGAKTDALITDEGRDTNFEWDGVWRVAALRTAEGWQAEIAIPFSTLRFDPRLDRWGLQVQRRVRRYNERAFWSPVPREASSFRISLAGELTGLGGVEPSRQLDIKPFVTANANDSREAGSSEDIDAGLDVKWGLSRSMRLDLTYNTDFAEVEVDEQRVNLTRFSLFFPERREFFLENSGIFEFGEPSGRGGGGGGGGTPLVKVFFSRRIGIDEDGQPLDVQWGARLTGRLGAWSFGAIDAQVDKAVTDAGDIGATNFGVFRLKRNLGRRSNVGLILTHRDESGAPSNTVYGLDFNYNPTDTIHLSGFVTESDEDSLTLDSADSSSSSVDNGASSNSENRRAAGIEVEYESSEWEASFKGFEIGESYEPGMGFLQRSNVRVLEQQLEYQPIISRGRIRNLSFGVENEYISTLSGSLESRSTEYDLFGLRTYQGDFFRFNITSQTERLFEEFEIADGVVLAPGRYDFDPQFGAFVSSSDSRSIGLRLGVDRGGFYNGDRNSVFATVTLRPSKHLRSETSVTLNDVTLPEGSFQGNVYRERISAAINPRLLFNGIVQYNEADQELGLNLRFNWIYRPGADLFVVFNQLWNAPSLSDLVSEDRQVIVKFTYLFQP